MKVQMDFYFGKWQKEIPSGDFEAFKQMAEALFAAADRATQSLMDMGEWATGLRELLGKEKFDQFCFDAGFNSKILERSSKGGKPGHFIKNMG